MQQSASLRKVSKFPLIFYFGNNLENYHLKDERVNFEAFPINSTKLFIKDIKN